MTTSTTGAAARPPLAEQKVPARSRGASPLEAIEIPVTLGPRAYRGLLKGFLFDSNKSFLLPSVTRGMRNLRAFYGRHPAAEVLVVGHTDREGSSEYNRALSVERAEAVAAYLRDDHAAWLKWYSESTPSSKRWGEHEDQLMIEAVAPRGPALPVTGVMDAATRTELIRAYMDLDGATLVPAVLRTHGCGESHTTSPTAADGVANAGDRRVEVFLFEPCITPLPVASCPESGCSEYEQWTEMLVETIDLDQGSGAPPVAEPPVAEPPAAEEPVAEEPPAEAPPAEQPAPEAPPAEQPSSGTLEERRYDYFKSLVQATVPALVSSGRILTADPVEFNEAEGAINVFGIRSMQNWRPIAPRPWEYDDWLVQVWIEGGKKRCVGYSATTEPGEDYARDVEYVSHLALGQWRYRLGEHKGYTACNPVAIAWWNDSNDDNIQGSGESTYSVRREGSGEFMAALNIHAGSTGAEVGFDSGGCQVLNFGSTSSEWQAWIGVIQRASNSSNFPYTLLDSSMLPGPVPE